MQQDLQAQLLNSYGTWRAGTKRAHDVRMSGKKFPGFVSPRTRGGKEIIDGLERMTRFCEKRSISPLHWMYFLFAKVNVWKVAPRPNQLTSEKYLEKFFSFVNSVRPSHAYNQQIESSVRTSQIAAGSDYDRNRDLTPSAEALKTRYIAIGDYQRCMDQMQSETLGFHPKSRICSSCPAAQMCEQKLRALAPNFDIVALRRGQQAEKVLVNG